MSVPTYKKATVALAVILPLAGVGLIARGLLPKRELNIDTA